MRIFLKFSYFFVFLWMFSCGNSTSKKADEQTTDGVKATTKIQDDAPTRSDTKTILFFGNSLTAGYGLDTKESFPSLIQNRLDSLNLNYTVINAGLSGETTSGGKNRLGWVLKQKVDIFVLELGANDDYPGVCSEDTLEFYAQNCPNPNLLLNF